MPFASETPAPARSISAPPAETAGVGLSAVHLVELECLHATVELTRNGVETTVLVPLYGDDGHLYCDVATDAADGLQLTLTEREESEIVKAALEMMKP